MPLLVLLRDCGLCYCRYIAQRSRWLVYPSWLTNISLSKYYSKCPTLLIMTLVSIFFYFLKHFSLFTFHYGCQLKNIIKSQFVQRSKTFSDLLQAVSGTWDMTGIVAFTTSKNIYLDMTKHLLPSSSITLFFGTAVLWAKSQKVIVRSPQ